MHFTPYVHSSLDHCTSHLKELTNKENATAQDTALSYQYNRCIAILHITTLVTQEPVVTVGVHNHLDEQGDHEKSSQQLPENVACLK